MKKAIIRLIHVMKCLHAGIVEEQSCRKALVVDIEIIVRTVFIACMLTTVPETVNQIVVDIWNLYLYGSGKTENGQLFTDVRCVEYLVLIGLQQMIIR